MKTKLCRNPACRRPFAKKRSWQAYCGPPCRRAHWMAQNGLAPIGGHEVECDWCHEKFTTSRRARFCPGKDCKDKYHNHRKKLKP